MSRRGLLCSPDSDSYTLCRFVNAGFRGRRGNHFGGYSMFGSLGVPELLIIFAIILVVFGAGKLPQLGKGLGEGISNFRDGLKNREEKKPATLEEKKNA